MNLCRENSATVALKRRLRRLVRNQRGALLLETVVALTVFGVLGATVLSSVQTSYLSKTKFDVQSEAENIIRNQMEDVQEQPYKSHTSADPNYLTITPPQGYTVTAEALEYISTSTDIETVRITVFHDGQTVKVFETLRANR